jgi:hypothetical protein
MTHQIIRFWEALVRHQELFSIPNNDKDDQMMAVLQELQAIDPRLFYHVGYRNEGPDLLISAEGAYDLSPVITQILAAAPLLSGWRVRAILDSGSLDGQRSETLYPPDENGDVLFGIAEQAGDLITSRPTDFCHVFPSRDSAAKFSASLPVGECSKPERYRGRKGFSWQIVVTRDMIPSHSNITAAEAQLAQTASRFGGAPDGWGFMSVC